MQDFDTLRHRVEEMAERLSLDSLNARKKPNP